MLPQPLVEEPCVECRRRVRSRKRVNLGAETICGGCAATLSPGWTWTVSGAMSVLVCERLRPALLEVRARRKRLQWGGHQHPRAPTASWPPRANSALRSRAEPRAPTRGDQNAAELSAPPSGASRRRGIESPAGASAAAARGFRRRRTSARNSSMPATRTVTFTPKVSGKPLPRGYPLPRTLCAELSPISCLKTAVKTEFCGSGRPLRFATSRPEGGWTRIATALLPARSDCGLAAEAHEPVEPEMDRPRTGTARLHSSSVRPWALQRGTSRSRVLGRTADR